MDILEKLLVDLNFTLDDGSSLGNESQNIIASIESHVFQSEILELNADYVFFFICSSSAPPSVLHFLSATIRLKSYIKAKCSALKFLAKLIKFAGTDVAPYADAILASCTEQLKIDDSNEVKAASIIPLRQLFHLCKRGFVMDPEIVSLDRLYSLLIHEFRQKKATSGTKYQILVTLGHMVFIYPDHENTLTFVDTVLDIAVSSLQKNFSHGKSGSKSTITPDLTIIAGSFSCLDLCMIHYADRLEGSVHLWKQLMMALSGINQESVFRFAMVEKALRLIKNHSSLFRDLIGVNIDTSYRCTVACFFSDKTACKKHAEEALLALLCQFSEFVIRQGNEVAPAVGQSLQSILKAFLRYLEDMSTSNSKSIILAVKGLTVLAPAIAHTRGSVVHAVLSREQDAATISLVDKLISTCEYLMIQMQGVDRSDVDVNDSDLERIKFGYDTNVILRKAQFLIAIVANLGVQPDIVLPSDTFSYILSLASDVVVGYSKLWGSSQRTSRQALCLFFMGMTRIQCPPFPSTLGEAVAEVMPCLFMRAMSRPDVGENVELFAIDRSSGETDGRLYYTYSFLWKELLSPTESDTIRMIRSMANSRIPESSHDPNCDQYFASVMPVLLRSIFSETAKNLLAFDLSYVVPSELGQIGMAAIPIPSNPADQELLLNLTSFLENMRSILCSQMSVLLRDDGTLSSHHYGDAIAQWLVLLLQHCTKISTSWPLVSALYRLCRLLTALWDHSNSGCHVISKAEHNTIPHLVSSPSDSIESVLCMHYGSVCTKILGEFQHLELISVSLRMVFDAPLRLLQSLSLLDSIIPIVMLSLRNGIQAKRCLYMLNVLLEHNLLNDDILVDVVPVLDIYLQSANSTGDPIGGKPAKNRSGISIISSDGAKDICSGGLTEDDEENGNAGVQIDVLRLLGRLGGRNKYILRSPSDILSSSLSWACFENQLKVDLPVNFSEENVRSQGGGSISIALGTCVPRIVELCMGKAADDKHIRANAAECLHGIVLVLIGQSATDITTDGSQFADMFETLLPTLLTLAVSTENIIKNLFDSLVSQVVHWLSTSRKTQSNCGRYHLSDMAVELLEALLAGLSRNNRATNSQAREADASYQDMCLRMVVEYYRWLQKSTPRSGTQEEVTSDSISGDIIITKLLQLSTHPSSEKRLGAANALNKLYVYIREETSVVLRYALRIIFTLLNAVKQVGASQEACTQAVQNYVKIIVRVSQSDTVEAAMLRQGKWKADASIKSLMAKSGLYSYGFDQEQLSDHPCFPYTLWDLTQWVLSNISGKNYVFRRQCMMCLGEFCPLLPLPENAQRPPPVSPPRPPHLQAIAEYLLGRVADGVRVESVASSLAACIYGPLENSANSLRKISEIHGSAKDVIPDEVILSDHMDTWLDSLIGALDSSSWIVRCVEPFDYRFMLPIAASNVAHLQSSKRKRNMGGPAATLVGVPTKIEGAALLDNVVKFYQFCSRCLLSTNVREIVSKSSDTHSINKIMKTLHLKITEAFRRSLQFLTFVLEKSPSNFVEMCSHYELCDSSGTLSTMLQLLLMSGVCTTYDSGSGGASTSNQRSLSENLASMADCLDVSRGTPTSVTAEVSFGSMLKKYKVRLMTPNCSGSGIIVEPQFTESDEDLLHLPVAIEHLLLALKSSFSNSPVISDLWKHSLRSSFEMLSPSLSTPSGVLSLIRTLSLLKKCGLLAGPFSDDYNCLLREYGRRIMASIGVLLERENNLAPQQLEVGNMLLQLAIDCGVSLGGEDERMDTSMMRIVFESLDNISHGSRFVQHFGGLVVSMIIGDTVDSTLTSNGVGLVGMLFRLSSTDSFVAVEERHNCCVLLRQLLAGVVERVTMLSLGDIEEFVRKCSNYAVLEGTEKGSLQAHSCVICTYENVMLLLHLECYLYRHSIIGADPELRRFALRNALGVFNSAEDTTSSSIAFPCGLYGEKCDVIVKALGMLPYFISGAVSSCPRPLRWSPTSRTLAQDEKTVIQEVCDALEEVVASKFPMKSASLDLQSQAGKDFSKIFKAWLDCFDTCGSLDLLKPLLPSLREGDEHIYKQWIQRAVSVFVNTIDYGNPLKESFVDISYTALLVCSRCIEVVLDPSSDTSIKMMFFDDICIPALMRCHSQCLKELCTSPDLSQFMAINRDSRGETLIKQLVDIISKNSNIICLLQCEESIFEDIEQLLLRVLCAYTVIESIYDRCNVEVIRVDITRAFAGENSSGKELTQAVCRSAHKLVRQTPPRGGNDSSPFANAARRRIQTLAMRVQTAAFNCLMLIVAKTQSEEQFFDNFLFKEKSAAADQQFWCNVIDCESSIDFESQTSFYTVIVGRQFRSAATLISGEKAESCPILPVRGVLSQHLLRSTSRLLSGSSIKKVSSTSQIYSQNQNRDFSTISGAVAAKSQGGSGGTWKEDPMDSFSNLTQPIPVYPSEHQQGLGANEYELGSNESGLHVNGLDDVEIALEKNHLNQQRCMGNLVRVICRMNTLFHGRWKDCAVHGNMPYWVTVCRDKLCDFSELPRSSNSVSCSRTDITEQRKNIRLFMLRLLMNQPVASIVAPFMSQCLLKPFIDCCLHDLCGIRELTSDIHHEAKYHYMIKDAVFTIVDSWPSSFGEADDFGNSSSFSPFSTITESAAAFLSYLIRHIFTDDDSHDSSRVNDNVRSVCAVVKLWVGGVPGRNSENLIRDGLDLSALVEMISSDAAATGGAHAKNSSRGSISVRKRLAGLEVLNCLQNCGYPVLFASNSMQLRWATDILGYVTSGCRYPRKEISVMSAHVVGSLLNGVSTQGNMCCGKRLVDDASDLASNVEAKLVSMFSMKNGVDSAVWCINAICQQFSSFLSREMLLKMFSLFGHLSQKARADFLEIMCNCSEYISLNYAGIGIIDYLRPYLSMLLNDVTSFSVGRGSSRQNIPLTQILTIRLIKLHAKSIVNNDVFLIVVFGSDISDSRKGSNGMIKFVDGSSLVQVRREAFQALMTLHSEVHAALNSGEDRAAVSKSRMQWQLGVLRVLLLRGLTDPDAGTSGGDAAGGAVSGLRREIHTYFEDNFGVSSCPVSRLNMLLSELYDPIRMALSSSDEGNVKFCDELLSLKGLSVSDDWLRYCSFLLLGTVRVDDNMGIPRKLFPQGLAPEDAYTPMENVQTSTSSIYSESQMTPLFAIENTQPHLYGGPVRGRGLVRGTQELAWTQTQELAAGESVSLTDPMPGSSGSRHSISMNADQVSDQEKSFFTQFITSPGNTSVEKSSQASTMPPPSGLPSYIYSSQNTCSSNSQGGYFITQRVPMRYHRTKAAPSDENGVGTQSSSYKATMPFPVYSKRRRVQNMKQDMLKRSAAMHIFRKYRAGELPDISVAMSDLMTPIQALCLRDPISASLFFNQLFKSLYGIVLEKCGESGRAIRMSLGNMLGYNQSEPKLFSSGPVLTSTTLVASIFTAYRECMSNEHRVGRKSNGYLLSSVDAGNIATAAISSLNYHAGILLLEDQILSRFHTVTADSSPGTVTTSNSESNWINLTRLYNHIEEKDIIQGLLFQISRLNATRDALDAEMRGNYPRAIEILNDLIEAAENLDQNLSDSFDFDAMDSSFSASKEIGEISMQERQMWNERSLECVRQLLDWDQLHEKIDSITLTSDTDRDVPIYHRLIDRDADSSSPTWLLSYYVHTLSHIGGMVMSYNPSSDGQVSQRASSDEMETFLHAILNSGDQSTFSSVRNMTGDVATCFLSMREITRAQAYASSSYMRFLESWSALHPCATSARGNLLAGLQRVVELEDAVALVTTPPSDDRANLEMTLMRWDQTCPAPDDPLWVWDDIGRVRSLGLMLYTDKHLLGVKRPSHFDDYSKVIEHLSRWSIKVAVAAVGQSVMQVVKNQLGKSNALRRSVSECTSDVTAPFLTLEEVSTVYQYNNKSINMVLQEGYTKDGEFQDSFYSKIIAMYEKTSALLTKKVEKCRANSATEHDSLLFTMMLQGEWFASWANFVRTVGNDKHGWCDMINTAFETLRYVAEQPRDLQTFNVASSLAVHGKLVCLCDGVLDLLQDYAAEGPPSGLLLSKETLVYISMESYINGLRAGDIVCTLLLSFLNTCDNIFCDHAGRDRLLRFFSLVGDHLSETSTEIAALTDNISSIPAWIFLKYAAQIIGLIDSRSGFFAVIVLEHVAKKYPKALYYPFKVTYPSLSENGRRIVGRLDHLLRDELCDCFVEALGGLTHPELRYADGLKQVKELIRQKKVADAESLYDEVVASCTDTEWPLVGAKIGSYNDRFARYMSKRIGKSSDHKGSNQRRAGSGLTQKSIDELLSFARDLSNSGGDGWTMRFSSGKIPLVEFSEWLNDLGSLLLTLSSQQFSITSGSSEAFIEIPGQYALHCDREPRVEEHSRILSVHYQLLAIASIRKPKRLGLLGSGGEEYFYLVKGGEDLRNDERIEQLFVLMNAIVRDASVKGVKNARQTGGKPGLLARTFSVTPMSQKLGILEWVKDTMPLKTVIAEEMVRDTEFIEKNPRCIRTARQKCAELSGIVASEERLKWLKGKHDPASYHDMIQKAKAESAQKLWRKMIRTIPDDFLRRRFIATSSSAEIFLTLRSECAHSLAVSSIFGYILGVGDRHLDNLLWDVKRGSIVQIDFGICFGMGSSVLPVPELIPFRLSPQLRALFQPLDGTNLLRHFMIETMVAIRSENGRNTLKNALEIYINDPVVDWLKIPLQRDELRELKTDAKWEPRRRIDNAMKKISGYHPVYLMSEDLQQNSFVKQMGSLASLRQILWQSAQVPNSPELCGNSKGSSRWEEKLRLDPTAQVDILINIATDPNVLVRHWVGLLTWV